jgi:membrane protein involved in D-alanine export
LTPYADFLYFGVLLYVVLPTTIVGFSARRSLWKLWIVAATVVMLVIQYWPQVQVLWPGTAVNGLALVAGYAGSQWIVARGFLAVRRRARPAGSRWSFYPALLLALAPLAAAKFVPVLAPADTLGFVGISYLTFRCLDVIFCIQDGLITELPPVQYLAFVLFFATISSGPIDRYRRFATDWNRDRSRADFLADLDSAVQHVFRGLLYKFILAALIKQYWMDPASGTAGVTTAVIELGRLHIALAPWTGLGGLISYMYAYSFYLFFDFAGYSAFAVGLSHVFGVHTPENFHLPFLARNIRDFWERWHISLSAWFRDHVYMRFVLAATKAKWFKNKYVASYLGFFLSMGLMGLWHGTAWHYIVYGLYHATLLVGHDIFSRWNKQHHWLRGRLWQAVSVFITFQAVCFGLLIFSGRLG